MHVRAVPWEASGWGVDGRVATGGRIGERGEMYPYGTKLAYKVDKLYKNAPNI